MRLRGGNYVAPMEASVPVDIYSSINNGVFNEPGTLLGSFGELSVGALNDYVTVPEDQITVSENTTYWIVLSTGSFEDLYAYQGGEVFGSGGIVTPSLRYQYNDTEWNQLGIRTFAMKVEGTVVPLPPSLFLFMGALPLLLGSGFIRGGYTYIERLRRNLHNKQFHRTLKSAPVNCALYGQKAFLCRCTQVWC